MNNKDVFNKAYLNIINEANIAISDPRFKEMINDYKILLTAQDDIENALNCGYIEGGDYDNDTFLCGVSWQIATNYYGKLFSKMAEINIQGQLLAYNKKMTDEIADRSNAIQYKVDAEYRIYYVMKDLILPYLKKAMIKLRRNFSRWFKQDISTFI